MGDHLAHMSDYLRAVARQDFQRALVCLDLAIDTAPVELLDYLAQQRRYVVSRIPRGALGWIHKLFGGTN